MIKKTLSSYMPRPLCHVRLSLVSGVESLLPAARPARRGQDADGLGVAGDEAADVVRVDAAVRVRGAAAEKKTSRVNTKQTLI